MQLTKKNKKSEEQFMSKIITITPTKIADYLSCPLKFNLKNKQGKSSFTPSPQSAFGTSVHKALEKIYKSPGKRDVGETLRQIWNPSDFFGSKESDRYFEKAKLALENYENKFIKPVLPRENTIDTEVFLTFLVRKANIRLTAKIDRLAESNGLLQVIDYKTGNKGMVPTEDSLKTDLPTFLYFLLAQKSYEHYQRIRMTYVNVESGNSSSVEYTTAEIQRNKSELWRVIQKIVRSEFPVKPSEACAWCEFRDECPATSRVLDFDDVF
jgi:RecB family exonuclease